MQAGSTSKEGYGSKSAVFLPMMYHDGINVYKKAVMTHWSRSQRKETHNHRQI
jgi:hypothetical protein